jgi:hypothetical protein
MYYDAAVEEDGDDENSSESESDSGPFSTSSEMGQYSLCPVATDTVVLSLPRMMGQKTEPWVSGSSAMMF